MVGECRSWNAGLLSEVVQGAQRSQRGSRQAAGVAGQGGWEKKVRESNLELFSFLFLSDAMYEI